MADGVVFVLQHGVDMQLLTRMCQDAGLSVVVESDQHTLRGVRLDSNGVVRGIVVGLGCGEGASTVEDVQADAAMAQDWRTPGWFRLTPLWIPGR